MKKPHKITIKKSFPVTFSHLQRETHFSPPVLPPLLGGYFLPLLEIKLQRLYCATWLKIKIGDSEESNLKKMLYTLSYWKKENLKVSSVTLFWLRDSSSQVPRVMSCLFFFTWLFFCSFVFVISSNETLKSQNLFKPETLSRVYVTVTNSTNTPRAYCITFVDPWKLV